ncbi:SDR family NAD(P)-dependent oxidoreductase [Candidatus Epulonipiscium viviparus]|uniref:SDR family NAD(P)-dependent oxidoreductase n=1 Tax=Candidatus Epulonipiscium viviparus TaxID=420336 RepID=UPI0027380F31|nr:SDR family oxidoreductase [Candidatus Epulopiscium viviparus]
MYNLTGQVCVVVGASSGIGKEVALTLARYGAVVVLSARRTEKLYETAAQIKAEGGECEVFPCDFREPYSVEALVSVVKNHRKKIDLWVNAAGANNAMGITWDISYEDWLGEVDALLKTCYVGTKCAINAMKAQGFGRIINFSGGGVSKPEVYNSAYACSKTAIVRFTECVNLELEAEKLPIKIFAFAPGLVRTQRNIDLVNKPETKKFMPGIIDKILNDTATPIEKPANFVAFIATGQVDGLSGHLLSSHMDKEKLIREIDNIKANSLHKIMVKS